MINQFKAGVKKIIILYFFIWIIIGLLFLNNHGYANPQSVSSQWHLYQNHRFHYQICYPSTMLPQGESDNRDGQVFLGTDGATIRVYGSYSLSVLYHYDFKKNVTQISSSILGKVGRITYRTDRPRWAVVSGYDKEGNIFYMKSLHGTEGQIMVVILTYPRKLKLIYDPLSKKISSCFKSL